MKKVSVFAVFLFFCIICGTALGQQYQYDPAEEEPDQGAPPPSSYPDSSYPYDPGSGSQPGYSNPSTAYPPPSSYNRTGIYPARLPDRYPRYSIEINGNSSSFEGRLGLRIPILPNSVFFGLGGMTSDKDFYMISTEVAYGNLMLNQKLCLDIGLKGVLGGSEEYDLKEDIGAVALMIKTEYNLPYIEFGYDRYIDLDIFGELSMSPEPLTFGDGVSFMESRFGLNINLAQNKRSAIILGYRYVMMEFDKEGEDWDKSDGSGYIGFRVRF
ncbi:MAG: hypothetical protein AB7S75_05080 [Desulfococcaceae bacterium]